MAELPQEFLKSLSQTELNDIVDHDLDAFAETPDANMLAAFLKDSYPELVEFTLDCLQRGPGYEDISEDTQMMVEISALVAIGAICRAAEIRSMQKPAAD